MGMSFPLFRNTASVLPCWLYASHPSGRRTVKSGVSTTFCTGSDSFSRDFSRALHAQYTQSSAPNRTTRDTDHSATRAE